MSAQPRSPNEEALWDEVNGLKEQIGLALEGWRQAIERTQRAISQTDRSIAQTQQLIDFIRLRDAAQHENLPKEKG